MGEKQQRRAAANSARVSSRLQRIYQAYLKTPDWAEKRASKLKMSPRCERCGTRDELHVHHVRYRNWFDVTLDDLETLCAGCHAEEHGKTRVEQHAARRRRDATRRVPDVATLPDDFAVWPNRGWTRKLLAEYGEPWPQRKGWKRRIYRRVMAQRGAVLDEATALDERYATVVQDMRPRLVHRA